jgi:hypothetical protein
MSGIPQSGRIPIRLPRADVMACGKVLQKTFSASQLEDVQPFDLFPHTRHLECVMTLVPLGAPLRS